MDEENRPMGLTKTLLFQCKFRKRAHLAEMFRTYKAREQAANIPLGSSIDHFVDLLFPETIKNTGQRAEQRKAHKEVKKRCENWL